MNYTLHQLRIFIKVAELESVTKASEALFLTQPAVSIQLKKLQEQFDLPLIEVIGKRIYLTDFGKKILESAHKILDEVENIRYETQLLKEKLVGKFRISIVSTAIYVMPFFLADFLGQYPGVELEMDVTNKSRVIDSLKNNEVDFSLVSVLPQNLEVQKVQLMKNNLFLVGSKVIPKRSKKKANQDILTSLPLIFREPGSATRQAMEGFIREQNIQVNKKIELTSNEAVKQAVLAGLGYSIMPLIGIRNALDQNSLHILPLEGLPITSHWNLIWLKNKVLSPIAQEYLKYVQEEKDQIIKAKFDWYENY